VGTPARKPQAPAALPFPLRFPIALAVVVGLIATLVSGSAAALASSRPAPTATATAPARMLGVVASMTAGSMTAGSMTADSTPAGSTPAGPRPSSELASGDSSENLVYGGGPVMHSDRTYAIYWEPPGNTSTAGYKDAVDGFLTDVASDSGATTNVYAAESLYWDSSGPLQYDSTFAGRIVDTTPYPAAACTGPSSGPCLTDAQLQSELQRLVAADGLPTGESTMYMIFTPPNVDTCDEGTCSFEYFCAYHSWIGSGPTALIYSDQPYVGGRAGCDIGNHPNGDDADPTVNVVSHEQNEAVTDPEGNAWRDDWGQEIGDKCAWDFGGSLGSTATGLYNQVIAGHDYWLQQEWSNLASACVQTNDGVPPPSVSITSVVPAGTAPGQTIAFAASASDPVGAITSYAWSFGDGQSASGPQVTHAFAAYGTYDVTVTVTDSEGETASDSQSASLIDQPIAVATASVQSAVAGASVTFDGSASHSPGGAITSYAWTFYDYDGDSYAASGPTVAQVLPHAGEFYGELTVTDAAGAVGSTSTYVYATARPPVAAIVASATNQFTDLSIDFDGTSSSGPDASITAYSWDFGDGSTSSSSSPAHTYATPGDYTVRLTVTASDGQTGQATQAVAIVDRPPIPVVVYLPGQPTVGQAVEFDGEGSYASVGGLLTYQWDFGDSGQAFGATPVHAFAQPGTYTVRLTVLDANGFIGTTSKQVVVSPATSGEGSQSGGATTPTTTPTTSTTSTTPVAPQTSSAPQPKAIAAGLTPDGSVTLASRQLRKGLRQHGLSFAVACRTACRILYSFTIPAHTTARSAGRAGRRTPARLLGRGKSALGFAGSRRLTVRLSRASVAAIKASPKPVLSVTITDPATGRSRTLTASTSVV
jgi:PKD repeat protein